MDKDNKTEIMEIAKSAIQNGAIHAVYNKNKFDIILQMSILLQELDKELKDIKDILHGGHYC